MSQVYEIVGLDFVLAHQVADTLCGSALWDQGHAWVSETCVIRPQGCECEHCVRLAVAAPSIPKVTYVLVLQELIRTATEVHRISHRAHDAWIALYVALVKARDLVKANTQSKPAKDQFRKAERQPDLLPCKLCGSLAELWQEHVREDIWKNFVCCTNTEDVDGAECPFHLPHESRFYRERRADAARYWNLIMGPRGTALKGSQE